eukprot:g4695.t1
MSSSSRRRTRSAGSSDAHPRGEAKGKGKRKAGSSSTPAVKRPRNTVAGLLGALSEQATCAVCKEVNLPIFQCHEGHVVCGSCKKHLARPLKCPTCRSSMPESNRNRALEAMAERLKTVPCQWAKHGCDEMFFKHRTDDADKHARVCKHRAVVCPIDGCGEEVALSAFEQHAREVHGATPLEPARVGRAASFTLPAVASLRDRSGPMLFVRGGDASQTAVIAAAVAGSRRTIECIAPFASGRVCFRATAGDYGVSAPAARAFGAEESMVYPLGGPADAELAVRLEAETKAAAGPAGTLEACWAFGEPAWAGGGGHLATKLACPQPFQAVATALHVLILDSGGCVWACGDNECGQLGLGDKDERTTPTKVPSLTGVQAVAAGVSHSLALDSE